MPTGAASGRPRVAVAAAHPGALVVRTSGLFGPLDDGNFVTTALSYLAAGLPFEAADDVFVSPTYLAHLADASLDLLIDETSGIWHLTNQGGVSWHELAVKAAARAGLDTGLITPDQRPGSVASPPPPSYRARFEPRAAAADPRGGHRLLRRGGGVAACPSGGRWIAFCFLFVTMTTSKSAREPGLDLNPDDWKTGDEPMTAAQRSYLETLCRDNNETFDENLSKAERRR